VAATLKKYSSNKKYRHGMLYVATIVKGREKYKVYLWAPPKEREKIK